jgi:predicted GNAT family N-acyltransferase
MILEARENAVPFYKSLGYEILKKSYLLFGEIQHYTMHKKW